LFVVINKDKAVMILVTKNSEKNTFITKF